MSLLPRRILIADHHTEPLPELVAPLSAGGHTVFQSSDVLATIETICERRPDLIVLSPLSHNPQGQEVHRILDVKDRVQYTPLLLICESDLFADATASLCGLVDDIVPRQAATGEALLERIQLCLGRLGVLRRMEEEKLALERQSITDFKTGTFNDRYFHRRLREEFSRARRHRTAISCVMLDFDNFKDINDSFDHAFGDFVLLAFAKKLRSIIRDIDIPARLGGDEFVLLLPNTGLDEAVRIAERIRRIVAEYRFEHDSHSTSVSLSIGISTFDGIEESSPEEFLRRADCALLEAKRRGRNRVVLYPQISLLPARGEEAGAAAGGGGTIEAGTAG
ncbi:MAG: GGDEF domain-containing protein [Planctomycetes bacterium]|nr:GGDEF domain-containing protein [Planctomycetota bacterium]